MISELPIVDSHVHFYDTHRPEGVLWPRAKSAFPATAFSDDLLEFVKPERLSGVVLVETGNRKLDDEWLFKVAENDPLVQGVVANLQPAEQGFEERLEHYARDPKLKGIRLRPINQYDLNCSKLRSGLKRLSGYGKTLELGVTSLTKLTDYIQLAASLPDVRCGLTHFGHPVIDGSVPEKSWTEVMLQLAALPNTFCKFSSLKEFASTNPASEDPRYYQPIVEFLAMAFGEDRVMFGSNWPNRAIAGEYKKNVDLYRRIYGRSCLALEKLFGKNAQKIYSL